MITQIVGFLVSLSLCGLILYGVYKEGTKEVVTKPRKRTKVKAYIRNAQS